MTKMERNYLDKVYEKGIAGLPMTPADWVGNVKYIPVTRIRMTCGGGMGGASWYEIVKRIKLEDLQGDTIIVTTYDGKKKLLNLKYMVSAEQFTVAERVITSKNTNYPIGNYTCRWLLPNGEKLGFANKYIDMK